MSKPDNMKTSSSPCAKVILGKSEPVWGSEFIISLTINLLCRDSVVSFNDNGCSKDGLSTRSINIYLCKTCKRGYFSRHSRTIVWIRIIWLQYFEYLNISYTLCLQQLINLRDIDKHEHNPNIHTPKI